MIFPNIMNIVKKIYYKLFNSNKLERFVKEIENNRIGNYLFLLFLSKPRIISLPVNFKPEEHISNYPPFEYGFPSDIKFRIEKMKYFLSLLSEIPANNKDLITENGYIPIHSFTIRNNIKDYLLYVNYLIATNVIVSDNTYVVGEKSKGFKWSEQYENAEFITYNHAEIIENTDDITNEIEENYPYLTHWYNQNKLVINSLDARRYAQNLKEFKMQNRSRWDFNKEKECLKYPVNQYHAILYNLGAINRFDYRLKIDENVHRLHTTLTNMQKDFRNFFTYNNETLVSIDLTNSQPYLSCALFNPEFWKENSILPLNFKSLPINIQSRFNEFPIIIMLGKFFDKLTGVEFNEYARIVSAGEMYEALIEIVREVRGGYSGDIDHPFR